MSLEYKTEDSKENEIKDLENEIDSDLSELEKDILHPRQVEKLSSWSVRLPYDWKWEKRDFILTKESSFVTVQVKKMQYIPKLGRKDWVIQKNTKSNPIDFYCEDKEDFWKNFWKILDKYIGVDRAKVPEKSNKAYDLLFPKSDLYKEIFVEKKSLKDKPIDLWYKPINPEKKIEINLPSLNSVEWRILRCMRWKCITDAVEKKYWIPNWLLLAMMAREWMWDPTQPNELWDWKSDWWLWSIHMQWNTAHEFWLETLPRHSKWSVDIKHWNEILYAKNKYDNDLKKLVKHDDRFHPILSIDAAARYLKYQYNHIDKSNDKRLNALKRYSWRALNDYTRPVTKYWLLINQYTGKSLPSFSDRTNHEIQKIKKIWKISVSHTSVPLNIVQNTVSKLSVKLDWKNSTYNDYLQYFRWQAENYWLINYINDDTIYSDK